MNALKLYDESCAACSAIITKRYSTSFSLGIRVFNVRYRGPIYGIYGFVRFADEIVDTFHDGDQAKMLSQFREDTFRAIRERRSLNPVLHSFQIVVNKYGIEHEMIEAFLTSMEMDLEDRTYCDQTLKEYIYGSAEVIGLMCLKVFCYQDEKAYNALKDNARALGSAFQKINFLRDMKSDFSERGRVYFAGIDYNTFCEKDKRQIEEDIAREFEMGYEGILKLPNGVRLGVYLAYKYYTKLFDKIKKASHTQIKDKRIRVNNGRKILLLTTSAIRNSMNML